MDFGMAYQHGDQRLTDAGVVLGTMAYLSPEQARGQTTDPRSDVYAVGLMLYEMLTGRRPPGDGIALPLALRESGERCPPPSRFAPEVHGALDGVVMRCLEREPARRYGSARDLEQALAHAGTALSSGSSPLGRPRRQRSRSWTALAGRGGGRGPGGGGGPRAALRGAVRPRRPRRAAWPCFPWPTTGRRRRPTSRTSCPLVHRPRGCRASRRLQVAPFASSRTFAAGRRCPPGGQAARGAGGGPGKGRVQGDRYDVALRTTGDDGRILWTRTIQGDVGGLLPRADQLSAEMASVLGAEAAPARASRPAQALEDYLAGRAFLEGWDVDRNYARAEESFRKAIAADPSVRRGPRHAGHGPLEALPRDARGRARARGPGVGAARGRRWRPRCRRPTWPSAS